MKKSTILIIGKYTEQWDTTFRSFYLKDVKPINCEVNDLDENLKEYEGDLLGIIFISKNNSSECVNSIKKNIASRNDFVVPILVFTESGTEKVFDDVEILDYIDVYPMPLSFEHISPYIYDYFKYNTRKSMKTMLYVNNLVNSCKTVIDQLGVLVLHFNLVDGSKIVDSSQKRYLSEEWENLNVFNPETMKEHIYRADYEKFISLFKNTDSKEPINNSENIRIQTVFHDYQWFRVNVTTYFNDANLLTSAVVMLVNVNKEMEALASLERTANLDYITKMPNINLFYKFTQELLCGKNPDEYAIVYLNIRNFRIVNEIYGTIEGDNILKYLGVRIQEFVGALPDGTYSRYSADSFVICISNDPTLINCCIDSLEKSLETYPIKFELKLSCGVYAIKKTNDSVSAMIDCAEAAHKQIRGNYVQKISWYDDNLDTSINRERTINTQMESALNNNEFVFYLQPKCEMNTGRIIGSEALVRWIHPKNGLVSPGVFIPILEKNGFVTMVDKYILRKVCEQLETWKKVGFPITPISVNISRTDLHSPKLFEEIMGIVSQYDIDKSMIEFEITESAVMDNIKELITLVEKFQSNGFKVLMDDFGAGYSSLNSLKEMNVDILKVDMKFMPISEDDLRAKIILRAVVEMAKTLKMEIIVEGVETIEQKDFLESIGVHFAQGYYYYRPMPLKDFEKIVLNQNKKGTEV